MKHIVIIPNFDLKSRVNHNAGIDRPCIFVHAIVLSSCDNETFGTQTFLPIRSVIYPTEHGKF